MRLLVLTFVLITAGCGDDDSPQPRDVPDASVDAALAHDAQPALDATLLDAQPEADANVAIVDASDAPLGEQGVDKLWSASAPSQARTFAVGDRAWFVTGGHVEQRSLPGNAVLPSFSVDGASSVSDCDGNTLALQTDRKLYILDAKQLTVRAQAEIDPCPQLWLVGDYVACQRLRPDPNPYQEMNLSLYSVESAALLDVQDVNWRIGLLWPIAGTTSFVAWHPNSASCISLSHVAGDKLVLDEFRYLPSELQWGGWLTLVDTQPPAVVDARGKRLRVDITCPVGTGCFLLDESLDLFSDDAHFTEMTADGAVVLGIVAGATPQSDMRLISYDVQQRQKLSERTIWPIDVPERNQLDYTHYFQLSYAGVAERAVVTTLHPGPNEKAPAGLYAVSAYEL